MCKQEAACGAYTNKYVRDESGRRVAQYGVRDEAVGQLEHDLRLVGQDRTHHRDARGHNLPDLHLCYGGSAALEASVSKRRVKCTIGQAYERGSKQESAGHASAREESDGHVERDDHSAGTASKGRHTMLEIYK